MTKYVASKYRGYVYKLDKYGCVSRIYYYPPSGKKGKFSDKILEIVPWFTTPVGADRAIGKYTPEEVDYILSDYSDGELFMYETKWVDANSLKITQKKMAIPKDRDVSVYSDDWRTLKNSDINYHRKQYPIESSKNIIRRRSRINPYGNSKRWI